MSNIYYRANLVLPATLEELEAFVTEAGNSNLFPSDAAIYEAENGIEISSPEND